MKIGHYTEEQVLSLAKKAYREGVATFDLIADKCALIVIDMQDEFVRPGWSPYWVPEATRQVPKIKRVIESCRSARIPVIYTVMSGTHRFLDRPATLSSMPIIFQNLDVDSSGFWTEGKVWHELRPETEDIVIHKCSYGAFFETPLETVLERLYRDTVIICGTLTNFCCGTTARQAYERSFKVVFGSDITATNAPELQEAELMTLRMGFAKVLSADEIVRCL
jgi:nicotinamidase-related amidase